MRNIILYAVFILLSACGGENDLKSVKLPLYADCATKVSAYIKDFNERFEGVNEKLKVEFLYFYYKTKIHQDIIGLLEISAKGVEDFELDVNRVKRICFPETEEVVGKDELGLRIVNNRIAENKSKGIKTYFDITEDKYIVYYNEKIKE